MVYRLSRSIYRELAPLIACGGDGPTEQGGRDALLRACETGIERLASDPGFAASAAPERFLFEEVRWQFPLPAQERVRRVIERHLALAREHFGGTARQRCAAHRRDGNRCRRQPASGADHCPSHRHLVDSPPVEAVAH